MLSYEQSCQYIEDNNYIKCDEKFDKYYCHKCNKVENFYTIEGFNLDHWSRTECNTCGCEHQGFEDKAHYLKFKKDNPKSSI
tara:strand:- start:39 stop:284 length:246 start_codon:yes stop_codon:yes gene_type:complete